jgi:invasion protein IalB
MAAVPVVAAALLATGSMAQAQQQKPAQQQKSAAVTPAGESQPTLLGTYGDWGAYTATPGGKKVCFALAKPKTSKTEPAGRKRDPAYIFISTRPAENVKNEVSLIIGYPFKASSDATAEIGSTKFAMYTQNDGAWIKNVAEEARMLDAMRKGSDLTVKGTSGRGTSSTDQFSLKGLSQALDRAEQECK